MWLTAGLLIIAIAGLCTFLFKSLVQQGSWATTTETKDAAESGKRLERGFSRKLSPRQEPQNEVRPPKSGG